VKPYSIVDGNLVVTEPATISREELESILQQIEGPGKPETAEDLVDSDTIDEAGNSNR